MNSDPQLAELLQPLAEPEDELASRRHPVDRERIISAMVAASNAGDARWGMRARLAVGLAAAASLALASWGGVDWWQHHASASSSRIEVVALRGSVSSPQSVNSSPLNVGETAELEPKGTLQTARGAEARIKTGSGIEIDLLENSQVSLEALSSTVSGSSLRLDRGQVRCVVTHQPGRTFSVVTAAARVIDIGTTFTVSVEQTAAGPKTTVHVEEGLVRVEFEGGQRDLLAPQTWQSGEAPATPAPPAASTEAPLQGSPPAPSARRERVKPRAETLAAEATLLRSGLAHEQKGDLRAAVSAFEMLIARYPDSQLAPDARSALARVKGRLESAP